MSNKQYQIEFNYNNSITKIKCNKSDKMKDIFKISGIRAGIDTKSKGFIYKDEVLKDDLTFEQSFNPEDIENYKIDIIVKPLIEINKNKKLSKKIVSNNKSNIPIQNKENTSQSKNNVYKSFYSNNNLNKISSVNSNENQNYLCKKNNRNYSSYCNSCKKDIFLFCEKSHNNHEIISFGKLIPDIDDFKKILII